MDRVVRVSGVVIYASITVWLSSIVKFQELSTCYAVSSITLEHSALECRKHDSVRAYRVLGRFQAPYVRSQGYKLNEMWVETCMTYLSAGSKVFFRLYEISERCCCRRLGKIINKSKRICPVCYVLCTDGSQDHSSSNWSLDCRVDDGELGFDSLEDQRHFFSAQCFVRGTCSTAESVKCALRVCPRGQSGHGCNPSTYRHRSAELKQHTL